MKNALFLIAIVLSGCATQQPSKVTTSEFTWTTNGFSMTQPKDTKFKRLIIRFKDGSSAEVEGYESTANAAAVSAIESANQAQAATVERGIDAFKEGLKMGVEGYTGRKIEAPTPASSTGQTPVFTTRPK